MAYPTIQQLRLWATSAALQSDVGRIGASRLDYAWRIVLIELLKYRPELARTSSAAISTTSGQATIDLAGLPATWKRKNFVQAFINTDYPLQLKSESFVRSQRLGCSTTGIPSIMAIYETTAMLYPTPDADYTIRWVFDEPLTVRDGDGAIADWTDGSDPTGAGNAGTYTINVDEEWARMACFRGVPCVALHADPNRGQFAGDWDRYVAWCMEQRGEAEPDYQVEGDII